MKEIYVIRHAEGKENVVGINYIVGRSNHLPLTEKGERQAEALGERLAKDGIGFDKVYSSSAVRAKETARISCEKMGISLSDIILADELLELSQGDWEKKPIDLIYTPEIEKVRNRPYFRPPNGESIMDVRIRMCSFVKDLIENSHEETKTAIYSHLTAIKCLLWGIMKFSHMMTHKVEIFNTSITQLKYDDRGWLIDRVNDYNHLSNL